MKVGERERLALKTADVWVWVWVYNSTVYNAKGTTWSGSTLWKQARQEVWQHWFIYSYIAAYIQVLSSVAGVHPTGLTADQGCRQVSTGTSYLYYESCRWNNLQSVTRFGMVFCRLGHFNIGMNKRILFLIPSCSQSSQNLSLHVDVLSPVRMYCMSSH